MIITQTDEKVNINLCSWCNQDMGMPKSRGAHRANCSMNPNKSIKIAKNRETKEKNRLAKTQVIKRICRCGTDFEVAQIGNKENKKIFCSTACANSGRIVSADVKQKSLEKRKEKRDIAFPPKTCPVCSKIFLYKKATACSIKCSAILKQDPIKKAEIGAKISKAIKGKTGGWRNFGGSGLKGYYEGFLYQSSWELAWIVFHLDHKIPFRRCTEFFEYEYKGKKSKYYPDFYLENEQIYVEVKGYMCEKTEAKIKSVSSPIIVLMENEMKQFLSYARAKGISLVKG
jgi:hypothetical protein